MLNICVAFDDDHDIIFNVSKVFYCNLIHVQIILL